MSAPSKQRRVVASSAVGIDYLVSPGLEHATATFLLHGIGGRAASFRGLLANWRDLASPLYAWDAPGYGGSRCLATDWPVAHDYAEALLKLTDGLGCGRINLIGHSLGALMAVSFARQYPERLGKLVLMAPALGYGVAQGGVLPEKIADRISDFESLGAERFAAQRGPRLVLRPESKPATVVTVQASMASLTMPGYGQAVRMLASGDLFADLAFCKAPVLVMTGTEDVITPPEGAARVAAALETRVGVQTANDRFVCVPDAGHAVYLEAAVVVAKHIDEFFQQGSS